MGQGRSLGVAVMNDFGFGGRGLAMFFFVSVCNVHGRWQYRRG